MPYRDPNIFYRATEIVGAFKSGEPDGPNIRVCGSVSVDAIVRLTLSQVIFLDSADRFIAVAPILADGTWATIIMPDEIGRDTSATSMTCFAATDSDNVVFPLESSPEALAAYEKFSNSVIPDDRRDVPTIKPELKELIIRATKVAYVSRSIRDGIPTGNNYQTLDLGNTLRLGGRDSRLNLLRRISFRNKSVLDIGANTGENSRIVRMLGASLVDGYEYDPYFVEIARTTNAALGTTRVSFFQGDCTRPDLFSGMKYDIILALSVWIYIKDVMDKISQVSDLMVLETHTLDHGINYYYNSIIRYFPNFICLGLSEKPKDPHKSRVVAVFGKSKPTLQELVDRNFLLVEPYYFPNEFVALHRGIKPSHLIELARHYFNQRSLERQLDSSYKFGTKTYFEIFLAGFWHFKASGNKVTEDNPCLQMLKQSIDLNAQSDLKDFGSNLSWLVRKVANRYEDIMNLMNYGSDAVAPVEILPNPQGKLKFKTTNGDISCDVFDGHHRYFMCELLSIKSIPYILSDKTTVTPPASTIVSNYTLTIPPSKEIR